MARCSTFRAASALCVSALFSLCALLGFALRPWARYAGSCDGMTLALSSETEEAVESLAPPQDARADAVVRREGPRPESLREREEIPPANAVLLRVVDASGAPVEGMPVGLIDVVRFPLPFDGLVRTWAPIEAGWQTQDVEEISANDDREKWIWVDGVVMRGNVYVGSSIESLGEPGLAVIDLKGFGAEAEGGDAPAEALQEPSIDISTPVGGQPTREFALSKTDLPFASFSSRWQPRGGEVWNPRADRPTLDFSAAFHWRGVTDGRGEAVAHWDRERFPLIAAVLAFPTRPREPQLLRAEDPASSATVTLVVPAIARVPLNALHDLPVCHAALWRARIAAAAEFADGSPAWMAWEAPACLPAQDATASVAIWERGLRVRIEGYVEAPFAPWVSIDPEWSAPNQEGLVLRSSEHYAGWRAEVRDADGCELSRSLLSFGLATWPESGAPFLDLVTVKLESSGRLEVLLAAQPAYSNARLLRLASSRPRFSIPVDSDSAMGTPFEGLPGDLLSIPGVQVRASGLDRYETHHDLASIDPPGTVREAGFVCLGNGPQILAGHVRRSDGSPVANALVVLPRGLAFDCTSGEDREALRTDAQGAFRRPGIASVLSFEVEVVTSAYERARYRVHAGRTDVVLELPR